MYVTRTESCHPNTSIYWGIPLNLTLTAFQIAVSTYHQLLALPLRNARGQNVTTLITWSLRLRVAASCIHCRTFACASVGYVALFLHYVAPARLPCQVVRIFFAQQHSLVVLSLCKCWSVCQFLAKETSQQLFRYVCTSSFARKTRIEDDGSGCL